MHKSNSATAIGRRATADLRSALPRRWSPPPRWRIPGRTRKSATSGGHVDDRGGVERACRARRGHADQLAAIIDMPSGSGARVRPGNPPARRGDQRREQERSADPPSRGGQSGRAVRFVHVVAHSCSTGVLVSDESFVLASTRRGLSARSSASRSATCARPSRPASRKRGGSRRGQRQLQGLLGGHPQVRTAWFPGN